jgi:uncharacterized protein
MAIKSPDFRDRIEHIPSPPISTGIQIADPGPLGLGAFAMTTFFLSVVNTNMVPASVEVGVLGIALFYGGIAQLLAGMWEFLKDNTFGAVAFVSYGAFWLSFWYLISQGGASAMGADKSKGVGLFLLAWTIFTVTMFICSTRTSALLMAVLFFLSLTFISLTIGAFGTLESMTKLGGWFGIVTAALGWYGCMAGVMNATAKRVVLPTFPR